MSAVTVPLRGGGSVVVTEPNWCVLNHQGPVGHPSEIFHESAERALTIETPLGAFSVLGACLDQWPLAAPHNRALRAVVDLDGEAVEFDPAGLFALAEQLVGHAAILRSLAFELERLRATER